MDLQAIIDEIYVNTLLAEEHERAQGMATVEIDRHGFREMARSYWAKVDALNQQIRDYMDKKKTAYQKAVETDVKQSLPQTAGSPQS